jgi:hypothetical protein
MRHKIYPAARHEVAKNHQVRYRTHCKRAKAAVLSDKYFDKVPHLDFSLNETDNHLESMRKIRGERIEF